jgi:4-hydroxybenzoate polyprenyltransferase
MVAVIAALGVLVFRAGTGLAAGFALVTLLGWRVLPPFWRVIQDARPEASRRAVKAGVLSLVLLDATFGSVYAGPFYALVILAVAGGAWVCARAFAVT